MASSSGSLTSPSPSPLLLKLGVQSAKPSANRQAEKAMTDGAAKASTNGRRVVDEESELSDLSDEGSEVDDDVPEDNSKEEEEEEYTEIINGGDAEESKDEDEGNQSGKSSTVTISRSRRKKTGSLLPGPMWGWAYKGKDEPKNGNDPSAANGTEDEAESEFSENWDDEDTTTRPNNHLNGGVSVLAATKLELHPTEISHSGNLLGTTLQEVVDELTHEPEESKANIILDAEAPNEAAPDAEVEDEIDPGAEGEAEADAEAEADEPEVADLDPSEEHDLNSALRVEALDALSAIEIKFAMLRERVYIDKMVALQAEEVLVDKSVHPELIHLQRELEKRRERRCGLALRKRKRDEEANVARKQTAELGLARWHKQARVELQSDMIGDNNKRKRKLERDKRRLERPFPQRGLPTQHNLPPVSNPSLRDILKMFPFPMSSLPGSGIIPVTKPVTRPSVHDPTLTSLPVAEIAAELEYFKSMRRQVANANSMQPPSHHHHHSSHHPPLHGHAPGHVPPEYFGPPPVGSPFGAGMHDGAYPPPPHQLMTPPKEYYSGHPHPHAGTPMGVAPSHMHGHLQPPIPPHHQPPHGRYPNNLPPPGPQPMHNPPPLRYGQTSLPPPPPPAHSVHQQYQQYPPPPPINQGLPPPPQGAGRPPSPMNWNPAPWGSSHREGPRERGEKRRHRTEEERALHREQREREREQRHRERELGLMTPDVQPTSSHSHSHSHSHRSHSHSHHSSSHSHSHHSHPHSHSHHHHHHHLPSLTGSGAATMPLVQHSQPVPPITHPHHTHVHHHHPENRHPSSTLPPPPSLSSSSSSRHPPPPGGGSSDLLAPPFDSERSGRRERSRDRDRDRDREQRDGVRERDRERERERDIEREREKEWRREREREREREETHRERASQWDDSRWNMAVPPLPPPPLPTPSSHSSRHRERDRDRDRERDRDRDRERERERERELTPPPHSRRRSSASSPPLNFPPPAPQGLASFSNSLPPIHSRHRPSSQSLPPASNFGTPNRYGSPGPILPPMNLPAGHGLEEGGGSKLPGSLSNNVLSAPSKIADVA